MLILVQQCIHNAKSWDKAAERKPFNWRYSWYKMNKLLRKNEWNKKTGTMLIRLLRAVERVSVLAANRKTISVCRCFIQFKSSLAASWFEKDDKYYTKRLTVSIKIDYDREIFEIRPPFPKKIILLCKSLSILCYNDLCTISPSYVLQKNNCKL